MEREAEQASCTDPLLLCCLCKSILQDPVQLDCLHSCCRQCLSSVTYAGKSNHVTCPSCNRVTQACDAEPNIFIERLVRGYAAVVNASVCAICKENGDAGVVAMVWCGSCRQSLCGDCMPAHSRYNRNHSTQSLDGLKSLEDPLLKGQLPPSCSIHKRPLEVVCVTCEKAKCLNCWAACNKSKHEMSLINDDSFEVRLQNLKSAISSMEVEILKKSEVFQKCKRVMNELKAARGVQLEKIQQRKRSIIDTVENVYREIELATKNIYDNLEMEVENAAALAASLEESLNFSRDYVDRLVTSNSHCDLWNQQKILRNHLSSLSAELDKLATSIDESKSVCIEPSLPENLEFVLKSWIGEPQFNTARASSQSQAQLFCAPSGSVKLPYECFDVALTEDGHVLLAARAQGLIELCTRGHTLSQWRPPTQINGQEDDVEAVHALNDGRVAVGVFYAQVVVLLRRSAGHSPSKKTWIEDRRLDKLQSPARRLSLHDDMLVVALWRSCEEPNIWNPGPQLALISVSNGKQLTLSTREYDIRDIALTAQAVITASCETVIFGDNHKNYVIDAHDRSSDVRLWRYEVLNNNEAIHGIFPDFYNRVLYVTFPMSDGSGGRVASIVLEDGSERRQRLLNFDDRLLPVCVTSNKSATVLATLCKSSETKQKNYVDLALDHYVMCVRLTGSSKLVDINYQK